MGQAGPDIIMAHGAGAGSAHPWMQGWKARMASVGRLHTFDYLYMAQGRKAPDRLPKLIARHREVVESVSGQGPVVLWGKSMGSRVGCHLSLELQVDALICMGYPLGRNPEKLRDQVLIDLKTPVLFVQGTRDPLCSLEQLAVVREKMTAPNHLYVVEDGNHSLEVAKRTLKATQTTQADQDAQIMSAITAFLGDVLG